MVAISGIFYPITHLPAWLQWLGQVFPIYWLGLGMRSALLPATMASVEIGHSWRHLETFGVLGRGPSSAWCWPDRAAPDGAPRVRVERGRPAREGHGSGST